MVYTGGEAAYLRTQVKRTGWWVVMEHVSHNIMEPGRDSVTYVPDSLTAEAAVDEVIRRYGAGIGYAFRASDAQAVTVREVVSETRYKTFRVDTP